MSNVINMGGRLGRNFLYAGDNNEPCMVVNNHTGQKSALIPQGCACKYNELTRKESQYVCAIFDKLRQLDMSRPEVQAASQIVASQDFLSDVALSLYLIAISLGIPTSDLDLLRLREFIADGLDELIKMPPFSMTDQGRAFNKPVVGEFDCTLNGERFSGEMNA